MLARVSPDVLLRAQHAVSRVLAAATDENDAYPALIAAIAGALGWRDGVVWLPDGDDVSGWPEPRGARVDGARDRLGDGRVAFPLGEIGVLAFAAPGAEPTDDLLATLESLGTQIGLFAERWRADARRAGDDRRRVRLGGDDGPPRAHRGGQPRRPAHVRLHGRGDDRPRGGRRDRPAGAARGPPRRARPPPGARLRRAGGRAPRRADRDARRRQRVPRRAGRDPPAGARAAAVLRLPARPHVAPPGRGDAAPAGRRAGRAAPRGGGRGRRERPDGAVRHRQRGARAAADGPAGAHVRLRPRRPRGDDPRRLVARAPSTGCRWARTCRSTATRRWRASGARGRRCGSTTTRRCPARPRT